MTPCFLALHEFGPSCSAGSWSLSRRP